ncbi:hypothetical protein UFOVP908_12 [uncultured Caudovirales phage]|uniref:Uncharacterized protein n=1 Tax=uncultured Caudovirales phage TaxID=2100421 RepID=A0A6J5QD55_9CAUD|nr:hypothetical protein UFOVP908_12 [uncultured Caudovirales phage]CAB4176990.1 hypothetical protein UFOVP990_124 [uncultured Caudovirales phage]CAB4182153.1 hypothetical protein UFOVP1065_155 [uncultured Caudovirales phage]CAB4190784.1 hypothetical protein UFOVP1198_124 [uncultured Caudovirales phage]CAB4211133.1 hypothetical protein UFOVP1418_116 [uncultured Caudovirales phage]
MDKITFESVMEEIKKSLGEARLMDIEEAMSFDEAENPASRAARQARQDAAAKQSQIGKNLDDSEAEAGRNMAKMAAKPVSPPAKPSVASQPNVAKTMRNVAASTGENAADRANATQNVVNPGQANAAAGQAARPDVPTANPRMSDVPAAQARANQIASNDAARASPATPTRPDTTDDTVSRMGRSAPGAPVASGRGDGAAELAARKAASTPSAPKLQGVTNQAAPKSQGVTNQPATSGGNKYGYAASGSDDDTASNFFRADAARMKDQGKKAPNDFSEAKKMYAENFDQFVKKFLKESR